MYKIAHKLQVITASVVCMGICSCSLFSSGKQKVIVQSSDPETILRADGQYIGKGQAIVSLKKNKTHVISGQKDGKSGSAVIGNSLSITGAIDLVFGFVWLAPWLGFLSNGAWALDEDSVYIDLH